MLDCCELCFEGQPFPDYRPLLTTFAGRVGRLADCLNELAPLEQETLKAAARWKLLYETEGVTFRSTKDIGNDRVNWIITKVIPDGSRIIGQGKTMKEAADKALGFSA